MTRALIVIPARFGSTRLPGKPLLAESGKPLIVHVCEAAGRVPGADVLVATDHEGIAEAVRGAGYEAAMTRADHETGSARVAEAAAGRAADVVVNLQGDEPEIDPDAVAGLIAMHRREASAARPAFVSTLASPFPDDADPASPSAVKAVLSQPNAAGTRDALYFSRARVPFPRSGDEGPYLHVGLYAFTQGSLAAFARMDPTPLERAESLEQLRVLERGHRIAVGLVPPAAPGIDTPEDYAAFVRRQGR